MGYLPPTTIAKTLRRIQRGELILPAIQREYVWKHTQVITLFDSIMRGYPIGGFLSWKVEPETVKAFRFYGFLRDFSEFDQRHNPVLDVPPGQAVAAILDGQQRLTSLNVGLRGTYAWRIPRSWRHFKSNYPARRLYLNVLGEAEENEAGLRYDFRFLTPGQVAATAPEQAKYWFPVNSVFEMDDLGDLWDYAGSIGLANDRSARSMLSQLWKAVHTTDTLHFYEEEDQDVEKVLDIFIRVNSGGTVLSYSDLLLSIATAQWKERDAREAIHGLVDTLNRTGDGFHFSQDVVLKSGLVLAGISDIAFRVRNFTAANMATLDRDWDGIGDSLKLAVDLLSDFGLSDATLTADSVLIPVACYVHRRGLSQSYRESAASSADRAALRSWVLRSLIMPGVWGSGLDSLLRDLRQVIDDHGADGFPGEEIESRMRIRGKSLAVTSEQVDDLLNLAYGAGRTFAVLAMLFPHVDTRNKHHIDHVFPRALLQRSKLRHHGLDDQAIEDIQQKMNLLPNLQLLEGVVNISKSDTDPATWAAGAYPSADHYDAYLSRNQLPHLPASVDDFTEFFNLRRGQLAQLIRQTLGGDSVSGNDAEATPLAALGTIASIEDDLAESTFDE